MLEHSGYQQVRASPFLGPVCGALFSSCPKDIHGVWERRCYEVLLVYKGMAQG